MADPTSTGNQAFVDATAAVEKIEKASGLSNDVRLELYGYFKQGILGDCNIDKPGMFDLKAKAKWEAWDKLRGMSKEDAQEKYIKKAAELQG